MQARYSSYSIYCSAYNKLISLGEKNSMKYLTNAVVVAEVGGASFAFLDVVVVDLVHHHVDFFTTEYEHAHTSDEAAKLIIAL